MLVEGLDPGALSAQGLTVTDDPARATVAVVKLQAPHELLHPNHFFGSRQHEGSLEFHPDDPAYQRFRELAAVLPTIAVVELDRAAVLTPIEGRAEVVLATFNVSDEAVAAVLAGRQHAVGRLPIDLPASMAGVLAPGTEPPLHPRGHQVWLEGRSG